MPITLKRNSLALSLLFLAGSLIGCASSKSTVPAANPPILAKVKPPPETASEFEALPVVLSAEAVVPKDLRSSPYHHLDKKIYNDGFSNRYRIISKFGTFEVSGKDLLKQRVQEVYVLAELDKLSTSEIFLKAVQETGTGIVTGPYNTVKSAALLVSDPDAAWETLKSVPDGVGELFIAAERRMGEGLDMIHDAMIPKEDKTRKTSKSVSIGSQAWKGASREVKKHIGYTKRLREWEQKLGVDPSTDNEILMDELSSIVWIETSVGFSGKFLPGLPGIPYAGQVTSYEHRIHQVADFEDPSKAREENLGRLNSIGVPEKTAKDFLNNSNIDPALRNAIIKDLVRMRGVKNRAAAIRLAAQAKSRSGAIFYADSIKALSKKAKSTKIGWILENVKIPAGLTKTGAVIIPLPVDYLAWTAAVAAEFEKIRIEAAKLRSVTSMQIASDDQFSDRAKAAIAEREISVVSAS